MKPLPRKSRYPGFLISVAFLIFLVVLYGEDLSCVFRQYSFFPFGLDSLKLGISDFQSHPKTETQSTIPNPVFKVKNSGGYSETQLRKRLNLSSVPFSVGKTPDRCDVFAGKWVPDHIYHPLYAEEGCPYIQPQLTCKEHGRPDSGYRHWKWKPHGCSLPRFNASFMWENLRGKRMLFIGDSLNRGQFVSMVCLLHSTLPKHAKSMETFDSLTVFRAMDYNATIEFYWAPFLVESNSDNAIIHRVTDRIVRAGSIDKHAQHWKGADILVFNSYLWWMTGVKMKILKGSFENEMRDIMEMETEDAYEMALSSMAKWVEENMDAHKTRVFFTSMSPSHEKSFEWGSEEEGNCFNQTTPIDDPSYWGRGSSKSIMQVIGKVFSQMKVPVTFLNITQLSEYRKDAHTSIYKKQWNPLTPEQLANPVSYADCVHWCLPGLQDTWNELLYTKLFFP